MSVTDDPSHARGTRIAHAGLATAVVVQLVTSQFMQVPSGTQPENFAFELHQVFGVAALALATMFWITVVVRIVGTDAGALFPWFSGRRLRALRRDIARTGQALRHRRLPAHIPAAPLASAVHGLGLLLISYMALSGTAYLIAPSIGLAESGIVDFAMQVHGLCGNLVWAYLIGHAGVAALYHLTDHLSLRRMWSLAPSPNSRKIPK